MSKWLIEGASRSERSYLGLYPSVRGGILMLVSDYVHPTPRGGRCRIRIYEEAGELPVVLCTELPDNEGTSITNAAEQIAAEVLANHPGVFDPFGRVSLGGLSSPTSPSSGSSITSTAPGARPRTPPPSTSWSSPTTSHEGFSAPASGAKK